jgi:hypothetical protein
MKAYMKYPIGVDTLRLETLRLDKMGKEVVSDTKVGSGSGKTGKTGTKVGSDKDYDSGKNWGKGWMLGTFCL